MHETPLTIQWIEQDAGKPLPAFKQTHACNLQHATMALGIVCTQRLIGDLKAIFRHKYHCSSVSLEDALACTLKTLFSLFCNTSELHVTLP